MLDKEPPSHHFSCQLEYVHYLTGLEKHETILTPLHAPGDKKTNVLDFQMAEFAEVINREMVHTAIDDMWHITKFQRSTSSIDLCRIASKNWILLKPINTLRSLNEATRLAFVAGGSTFPKDGLALQPRAGHQVLIQWGDIYPHLKFPGN